MREQRPRDMSPVEIGFHPQRPVPWLNPGLLIGTGVRVGLAYALGSYLDKRELQAALPGDTFDHSGGDELWLDFTADGGDGFDATYSIAYLMAQPEIKPDGAAGPLPRGSVTVLGGDQVYPTASAKAYEERWKGPYRAALPEPGPDSPTLYALPGNHDWYDGLTAFLRLFAQEDPAGGWLTAQHRSYFALELPHHWWLLAMDIQLDSYIDEPQLQYFAAVAERLGPDDKIILTTARPAWVMTGSYPEAYDSVDYFVRTIIRPTGARIPVMLAGDKHHYSRYAGPGPDEQGRQLITCGGGGAYLTSTGHLPDAVQVPPSHTLDRKATESETYQRQQTYPAQPTSRRLAWGIFARLPLRNPGFSGLLGFMQTLLMLAVLTSDGQWINAPIGFAVAAVFAGTYLFAVVMGRRGARHRIAGVLHAVPHVALGVAGAAVWTALPFIEAPAPWGTLLAFVIYLPVVALLDTWIVAAYLLVASRFGVNINELHAGLGIDDYKCFLRMHVGTDGTLTIYPIGVDRVGRKWQTDPDAPTGASWIRPVNPLVSQLIEPPVEAR
ncbi:MAG TPA: hypothetical protein VK925_03605 [Jiangellaceae bacterium]|nr:hypothetical protein [Jiangellaceae bacterium]